VIVCLKTTGITYISTENIQVNFQEKKPGLIKQKEITHEISGKM